MATIASIGTAVPEHTVRQEDLADVARAYLDEHAPELLDLLPVFLNAGVDTRQFARPIPWYLDEHGWHDRNAEFTHVGTELAERAVTAALADADVPPSSIDGVVFVTTTGLATPSLEAHLANRIGLRPDATRTPVWGLGCAGGVAGLARTADLATARPDGWFLLVSLEVCSLAFLSSDMSKKNVVAAAIFGDGCAAALVAGADLDVPGPTIEGAASHLWPDTLDVMGWDVLDEGLGVVFSRSIPDRARHDLPPVVQRFRKEEGIGPDHVPVFHPGGAAVIDAYRDGLGLTDDALEDTTRVLSEHGNMSSPTALFVLDRCLRRGGLGPGDDGIVAALGPGFAAELVHVTG